MANKPYKAARPLPMHSLLLSGLLAVNLSSFADSSHWKSPEYIQNSFIEIALKNEYSAEISTVRKWTKPIYYTIIHRTADQALHTKITKIHLSHLANITGIEIKAASSSEQANLTIIFSAEDVIRQELKQDFLLKNQQHITALSRNSVCLAYFTSHSDNSIKQATVIIPVDRARAHAKLLSCVVEELTQIMGLANDSDKVFPSIFNDNSHDDFLSGLDFILLKLLYHPVIKPGMKIKHVREQLAKILSKREFQQLIQDSELLVHQQGIYTLLD